MTAKNLQEILRKHTLWLNGNPDGEKATLYGADLYRADLRRAALYGADLRRANLYGADLSCANINDANLNMSNLSGANLSGANLYGTDLSGANGLLSAVNFMEANFERTENGYIAYKTFGGQYTPPEKWEIKPGSIIEENVNFDRCDDCGCGVNVAPIKWIKDHYIGDIWKVLIRWEWLAGVCVPYNSKGKIRCERVELIEIVK